MSLLNCSREDCKNAALEDGEFCFTHAPRLLREIHIAKGTKEKFVRATRIKIEFIVMGDGAGEVARFEEIFNTRIKLKVTSEKVLL